MTTRLDKTLKRELEIDGRVFVAAISPGGLKLTLKGKRKGLELAWVDLVNGEAALATALHASLGRFERTRGSPATARAAGESRSAAPEKPRRDQRRGAARAKPASRSGRATARG